MSTGIHTKLLLRGLDFLYTGREAKTKGLAGVCVCVFALELDGGGVISIVLQRTRYHVSVRVL